MVDFSDITACLITREPEFPADVLAPITSAGFKRILIYPNCPAMSGRDVILREADTSWMFTCDDDSVPALDILKEYANPDYAISTVMSPDHIRWYADKLACLFNWGALISKDALLKVDLYRQVYGQDFLYHREYDRILSYLNYPQHRIEARVTDLPRSAGPGRVSSDPRHFEYLAEAESRCRLLLNR